MEACQVAQICKALGEENRVKIVELLTNSEKCACELLEDLSISQSTLSHHMKVLAECDLILTRKEGKWSYYSLNCQTLGSFRSFIAELNCNKQNRSCDCQ